MNSKLLGMALVLSTSLEVGVLFAQPASAVSAPYTINKCLARAEELFKKNDYREAVIFYYEGLSMTSSEEIVSKLHFRIGECLEALRRFEFATYHYKLALKGKLSEVLASRAFMKLEHLPELAQTEEATRLFKSAMELYRKRNIRAAIDDYLASLRLMPTLMEKDEMGLIEDGVKYLTYLSETKDKEPDRLLKLATLLELRGDIEKSVETLQQIIIIYPDSDQARQADEKLENFSSRKTAYIESVKPHDAVAEIEAGENVVIFEDSFEFSNAGMISRDVEGGSFTLKAFNEREDVPANRFEWFSIVLGSKSEQREYLFSAEEGITQSSISFDTANNRYLITFSDVSQTTGYIQDLYGRGRQSIPLFSSVRVLVKVIHKY